MNRWARGSSIPHVEPMKTIGAVCVMAKTPRLGRVKTRLARTHGDERAVILATAFLEDTLSALERVPARLVLALDDLAPSEESDGRPARWAQGGGSLGDRLEHVLGRALQQHPWAIALGTDSPGLPPHLLIRAMDALEAGADAVLGPCRDGGFYLLGVRALPRGALEEVRWSTPDACQDTERALLQRGLHAQRLEPWFDVDEASDLAELARGIEAGMIHAPATARVLGLS